ncbi:MAG: GAF domain-containing protein [Chloroflexi bacterium]|nr:MAG: GAF domain-containing protein [Chloroflexota bacterium]
MDSARWEEQVTLEQALRRARLLAAAAEVSQNITRILNLDELLPRTVDIICETYGFYYAGIFLLDETGEFAVLKAGRGEPGRLMVENNHKLAVGGSSMIGMCTARNEARISLDVDTEQMWYPNPLLPDTRSEMALPLAVGGKVIGALTVQSTEAAAFSEEDISSLQALANQLAIAIDNARQRQELEETYAELVRAKTFEAIASATGDAIHWIGNKAEPIGSAVARVRRDVETLVCAVAQLLRTAPEELRQHPLAQLLFDEADMLAVRQPYLLDVAAGLLQQSPDKLARTLSTESILEDLDIINEAARLIMKVKEEYIGPAREQAPRPTMADDVLEDALTLLNPPAEQVSLTLAPDLPLVLADPPQLHRVFQNVLRNALEAVEGMPDPRLSVTFRLDSQEQFVLVDVADNGPGIPAEALEKIWVAFHTTKDVRRHSGLGLPACRLILEHIGGQISVSSQPGQGTVFTIALPVYRPASAGPLLETGRGKILLVDDFDHWRDFAADVLRQAGYKVYVTPESYRCTRYNGYDLILVDDILRHTDALDVLAHLKAENALDKTIVVTSNPRLERVKQQKQLGLPDVQPKPYTTAELLRFVRRALASVGG